MHKDLVSTDPTNAAYYKQQHVALNASLGIYTAAACKYRASLQFQLKVLRRARASVKYCANQKPARLKAKSLKETELKLLCELLKGSRRSDRELAKRLGVSQPTVTRVRSKLEKEGIIKEYTMIPDFQRLGFQLMSVTFLKFKGPLSDEGLESVRITSRKLTENYPSATILALSGMGIDSDRVIVTYHKDYSEYADFVRNSRTQRALDIDETRSFLVNLNDRTNFLPLTFSLLANYLQKSNEKSERKK